MLNAVQNKQYLKKHYNCTVTPSSEPIVTRQSQIVILILTLTLTPNPNPKP